MPSGPPRFLLQPHLHYPGVRPRRHVGTGSAQPLQALAGSLAGRMAQTAGLVGAGRTSPPRTLLFTSPALLPSALLGQRLSTSVIQR